MLSADEIIRILDLKPLEMEGGFYRESYRSQEKIPRHGLPGRYRTEKHFHSAIYYLLTPDTFSALHRLPTDEVFHFYLGDPVRMLLLHPDGKSQVRILGSAIERGQELQALAAAGDWQGSYLEDGGSFALMGTTMAPGFDFSDYEGGERVTLSEQYPERRQLIARLTRA